MSFTETELRSLIEAALDAFNRRDLDAVFGGTRPEYEFHLLPDMPDSRILRGPDETIAYFAELFSVVPDWRVELVEVRSAPPFGVTRLRGKGIGSASGAEASGEWSEVHEFDDLAAGPVRTRQLADHEDALRAAGLSPP